MTATTAATTETITLGGGCFWCLEAVYDELRGVTSVVSGYAGGRMRNPTYGQVTSGTTGHAEVVEVTFDPLVLSRDDLLDVFFAIHDPTTKDRQGNDVGPQYRSIAFHRDESQKAAIEAAIARTASGAEYRGAIVTEVVPFEVFYPAEDYHQQYYAQHGSEPYCSLVIAPKVAKFRKRFAALRK
ncbi:MAG TPA: peptide-methionine (S)-S-oxide reductase MsrA [Candidatus Saccharimonadia bacterium]|nr:peptide-methionine (S)-S-oxide reductase MsrA [Candidatus Saccharimonadia bacterium]